MPSIVGSPILEADFTRLRIRRLTYAQYPEEVQPFIKFAAELLDYSVDLYQVLNPMETITAAWASTSVPDELQIASVHFAQKGFVVSVWGGLDAATYLLSMTAATSAGRLLLYRLEITVTGNPAQLLDQYIPPIIGTPDDPAQNYLTDVLGKYIAPTWTDEDGNIIGPDYGES